MSVRVAITFFTLLAAPACTAQPRLDAPSATRAGLKLEAARDAFEALRAQGFSGAVAITQRGRILLEAGAGSASPTVPFSADTVIDMASLAKPITAMAVQKLMERGIVSLDDKLTKWYPDIPADKQAITIRQLLTHTSGIVDIPSGVEELTRIAADEMAGKLFQAPLTFAPGSEQAYSNGGFTLLALIVERASNTSFFNFLHKEILDPAKVRASYDPQDFPARQVAQAFRKGNWLNKREEAAVRRGPFWGLWGAGGIYMSAKEMARLVDAFAAGKIVPSRLVEEAWGKTADGKGAGLAWGVRSSDGETIIGHLGGSDHSMTLVAHYRTSGVTMVIVSNGDGADVISARNLVARALFGQPPQAAGGRAQ
jgi:CubicO group peptidase (beta-lactamase class C family)